MDPLARRKEPAVISARLLLEAIEDDDADAMRSSLPEHEIVLRASTITLSFKNLLKIENLELLRNVRTLRLDNNMITKIEGLSHLRQLTWLDLSFNRIKKIEGLETLEHLQDLSLFNNEIRTIAALEGLKSLQCLSLGNNQIEQVEQVLYLKRLPKLEVLVLDGNPMSRARASQYRAFCLAFLPGLRYFDYALVLPAEIAAAKENGVTPDLLAAVEDKEAQRRKTKEATDARSAFMAELQGANIDATETLWPELFVTDGDYLKLKSIPKMNEAVDEFKKEYDAAVAEFREAGLEKSRKIEEEIAVFNAAATEAVTACNDALSTAISGWEQSYQRLARTISANAERLASGAGGPATGPALASARRGGAGGGAGALGGAGGLSSLPLAPLPDQSELDELVAVARGTHASALRDELRLHAAVEDMANMFETVLLEMLASKVALHESFFRNMEGHEGAWHARVVQLADEMQEGLREGSIRVEDEELLALAQEKETFMTAVTGCHEGHVTKIYRKEAEMKAGEERRCKGAVAKARENEFARSRARVEELDAWMDSVISRIAGLRAELEAAEEAAVPSGRDSATSRGSSHPSTAMSGLHRPLTGVSVSGGAAGGAGGPVGRVPPLTLRGGAAPGGR